MSLVGSGPVAGPSHRPEKTGGGPLPTGHPSREREIDALRAAVPA